jgi:outer membrane immunogenic protein
MAGGSVFLLARRRGFPAFCVTQQPAHETGDLITMEFDMKISVLGGVTALSLAALVGQASAADLPRRNAVVAPAPFVVPPAFTWTGFYAGLNAGARIGSNDKVTTTGNAGFVGLVPGGAVPGSLRIGDAGFAGGAQIGYNQQFGMIVAGLETDFQYVGGQRGTAFTGATGIVTTANRDDGYLGTLRARLGLVASDRLMVYVTGGLAYGSFDTTLGVTSGAAVWGGSSDKFRAGWTVGAGAEYALTSNWTAKLEYLYYDLGRQTITAGPLNAAATATGLAYQGRADNTGNIVRAGVNYKF